MEASVTAQVRGDGALDQGSNSGSGERWLKTGCAVNCCNVTSGIPQKPVRVKAGSHHCRVNGMTEERLCS